MPTPTLPYYHNIDLDLNELISARFYTLTTTARLALTLTINEKGLPVYDSTALALYIWNGTTWTSAGLSISAGTGMSFTTITTSGSVSIDTTKVPYFASGFSTGFLKYNGSAWVFDTTSYEPTITAGTTGQYWRGDKSWQTLDKSAVGLSNVDNTSDVNKPVSTAQATAIALKEDSTNKSTSTGDSASSTKFPVWSAILSYFDISRIKTILGISTLSGSNTGDQTIALTGDVTGSGTGSFAATIAAASVTLTKQANLAANSIQGNNTGSPATPLALTVTQVTAMLNVFNGTTKGLVPVYSGGSLPYLFLSADGNWQKIGTSAIADQAQDTVIANTTGSSSSPSAIAISDLTPKLNNVVGDSGSGGTKGLVPAPASGDASAGKFLKADGLWAVPTTTIGTNVVTNSMLAQVATAIFKGRTTAGTGNVEDLTVTQATAMLNTFTSSLKGLVPLSGGGTTNFLRADGTWAAPSGGGGITRSVNSISSGTTAGSTANTDYTYIITGTTTLTLPTAVGNTNEYTIKRVGTGVGTIATTSSQTVDGQSSWLLNQKYMSITVYSDGSNWLIK